MDKKLMALNTAYLGKIISIDGNTAKIQPLGKVKEYNKEAKSQAPLSNVPILQSATYKLKKEELTYVVGIETTSSYGYITSVTPITRTIEIFVPGEVSDGEMAVGDIALCVCCDRDITAAKRGENATPAAGHHSQSSSIIVGVL